VVHGELLADRRFQASRGIDPRAGAGSAPRVCRARAGRALGDAMASITQLRRRLARSEHGAELIEFAVVLPILMLFTAGIFDFAVLFQHYEVVTNAAREGARVGVLPGYQAADIQNRVQSYLAAAGLTDTAPTPIVTYGTAPVGGGGLSINTVSV